MISRAVRQKAPIHRALRAGGRHYSENWQAWQTVKKANLVRLSKVSFFDPGVSRKSPVPWHFLGFCSLSGELFGVEPSVTCHQMLLSCLAAS